MYFFPRKIGYRL